MYLMLFLGHNFDQVNLNKQNQNYYTILFFPHENHERLLEGVDLYESVHEFNNLSSLKNNIQNRKI